MNVTAPTSPERCAWLDLRRDPRDRDGAHAGPSIDRRSGRTECWGRRDAACAIARSARQGPRPPAMSSPRAGVGPRAASRVATDETRHPPPRPAPQTRSATPSHRDPPLLLNRPALRWGYWVFTAGSPSGRFVEARLGKTNRCGQSSAGSDSLGDLVRVMIASRCAADLVARGNATAAGSFARPQIIYRRPSAALPRLGVA